jgi:nitrogen regulatory protein PII
VLVVVRPCSTVGAIGRDVKRPASRVGDAAMPQDDPGEGALAANALAPVLRTTQVVQILALVKPFRAQAVLDALGALPILGGTVREAMGYGRQKNRLHRYLGSEYNTSFVPKVELSVFVEEAVAAQAIRAIVGQARTGRIGDGKILVLPCSGEFLSW